MPPGYPRSYGATIDAATREGALLIWSAIDRGKARALLDDFRRLHPAIRVTYVEIPAKALNARFLSAVATRGTIPDFLWSSAMDLQIKLTNDGYAQRYVSPEAAHLPEWANWKNEAWGTTAEPIVLIYNRRLIDDAAAPRTHKALIELLERHPDAIRGRVATYDLATSAVGYLYLSQDQQATHDVWRLGRAMAANDMRVYASAEQVLDAVADGEAAIGYNIVGSYALDQIGRDPALGMVLPRDYTLVMSRIALIPAAAPHPDAAKLFVDFLLSPQGQRRLAQQSIPPVRGDVPGPAALRPADVPMRAIRVGPSLLVAQDRLTQRYFMTRWTAAIRRGPAPPTR